MNLTALILEMFLFALKFIASDTNIATLIFFGQYQYAHIFHTLYYLQHYIYIGFRNSLEVQWLGFCVFTAEGAVSIPGQAVQPNERKKKSVSKGSEAGL